MGGRVFNAGGWAYMPRVWCPDCGFSFLIGNERFRKAGCEYSNPRPLMRCGNRAKCRERQAKKKGK